MIARVNNRAYQIALHFHLELFQISLRKDIVYAEKWFNLNKKQAWKCHLFTLSQSRNHRSLMWVPFYTFRTRTHASAQPGALSFPARLLLFFFFFDLYSIQVPRFYNCKLGSWCKKYGLNSACQSHRFPFSSQRTQI